mmetsp:Transcript_13437/g.29457  ORF Transcript_13437/g.29457 Transcript_13437/m.29457 type:complete len:108 (+) Transcript_13437:225-548(+)
MPLPKKQETSRASPLHSGCRLRLHPPRRTQAGGGLRQHYHHGLYGDHHQVTKNRKGKKEICVQTSLDNCAQTIHSRETNLRKLQTQSDLGRSERSHDDWKDAIETAR